MPYDPLYPAPPGMVEVEVGQVPDLHGMSLLDVSILFAQASLVFAEGARIRAREGREGREYVVTTERPETEEDRQARRALDDILDKTKDRLMRSIAESGKLPMIDPRNHFRSEDFQSGPEDSITMHACMERGAPDLSRLIGHRVAVNGVVYLCRDAKVVDGPAGPASRIKLVVAAPSACPSGPSGL